jgi:hypothetical protein
VKAEYFAITTSERRDTYVERFALVRTNSLVTCAR